MTRRVVRASWTCPEPGLLTATTRDEVRGYVLTTRGGYIAFDAARTPLGCLPSLRKARRAVIPPTRVVWVPLPAWASDVVGVVDRWVSTRRRRFPTTPA